MKKLGVFLFGSMLGIVLVPMVSLAGGAFYIDSSTGYVGIGNTTPASPLDVLGAMYSRLVTDSDSSSVTVDWNTGNVHSIKLNTSATALTFSNGQAGGKYDLILAQDATGGRTVTWPAAVKWNDGSTPTITTTANSTTTLSFLYDGGNYLGSLTYESAAPAPIAFDADNGSLVQVACDGSAHTWTHTPVSGSPSMVVVGGYMTNTSCIAGITYGGQAMTLLASSNASNAGDAVLYYLANPPSGAQTVSVSTNNNTGNYSHLSSATYTGGSSSIASICTIGSNSTASSYDCSGTVSGTTGWIVGSNVASTMNPSSISGGGATFSDRSAGYQLNDSNGTVTSGSDTFTVSYSGNQTGTASVFAELK